MKLFLIIALTFTLTNCNFLSDKVTGKGEGEGETDSKKEPVGFEDHFVNELITNNTGDFGRDKTAEFSEKAIKITDITTAIATEFGIDVLYPQYVSINKETNSKVEVSFSIVELETSYVDDIKEKFRGDIETKEMEYHMLIKYINI